MEKEKHDSYAKARCIQNAAPGDQLETAQRKYRIMPKQKSRHQDSVESRRNSHRIACSRGEPRSSTSPSCLTPCRARRWHPQTRIRCSCSSSQAFSRHSLFLAAFHMYSSQILSSFLKRTQSRSPDSKKSSTNSLFSSCRIFSMHSSARLTFPASCMSNSHRSPATSDMGVAGP